MEIESRQKLAKFKVSREFLKAADKILGHYLRETHTIPEITDKVYAVDKAIETKI